MPDFPGTALVYVYCPGEIAVLPLTLKNGYSAEWL